MCPKYSCTQILSDLEDVNIQLSFNEISEMSVYAYKELVDKLIKGLAFYWLFSLRSQMLPVRCNFKSSYADLSCQVCEDTNIQDSQSHILQCDILVENENMLVSTKSKYCDLFSSDFTKQFENTAIYEILFKKQKQILKKKSS